MFSGRDGHCTVSLGREGLIMTGGWRAETLVQHYNLSSQVTTRRARGHTVSHVTITVQGVECLSSQLQPHLFCSKWTVYGPVLVIAANILALFPSQCHKMILVILLYIILDNEPLMSLGVVLWPDRQPDSGGLGEAA